MPGLGLVIFVVEDDETLYDGPTEVADSAYGALPAGKAEPADDVGSVREREESVPILSYPGRTVRYLLAPEGGLRTKTSVRLEAQTLRPCFIELARSSCVQEREST